MGGTLEWLYHMFKDDKLFSTSLILVGLENGFKCLGLTFGYNLFVFLLLLTICVNQEISKL
jgi:hypothetical protein